MAEGWQKVHVEAATLFERLLAEFPHLLDRPEVEIALQRNANGVSIAAKWPLSLDASRTPG
jgi:hypothetical protein